MELKINHNVWLVTNIKNWGHLLATHPEAFIVTVKNMVTDQEKELYIYKDRDEEAWLSIVKGEVKVGYAAIQIFKDQ
jgi:hypothetical protein